MPEGFEWVNGKIQPIGYTPPEKEEPPTTPVYDWATGKVIHRAPSVSQSTPPISQPMPQVLQLTQPPTGTATQQQQAEARRTQKIATEFVKGAEKKNGGRRTYGTLDVSRTGRVQAVSVEREGGPGPPQSTRGTLNLGRGPSAVPQESQRDIGRDLFVAMQGYAPSEAPIEGKITPFIGPSEVFRGMGIGEARARRAAIVSAGITGAPLVALGMAAEKGGPAVQFVVGVAEVPASLILRPVETLGKIPEMFTFKGMAELGMAIQTQPFRVAGQFAGAELTGFSVKRLAAKRAAAVTERRAMQTVGGKELTPESVSELSETVSRKGKVELTISELKKFTGELDTISSKGFSKTEGVIKFKKELSMKNIVELQREVAYPGEYKITFGEETITKTPLSKRAVVTMAEGEFRLSAKEFHSLVEGRGIDITGKGRTLSIDARGGKIRLISSMLGEKPFEIAPLHESVFIRRSLTGEIEVSQLSTKPVKLQKLQRISPGEFGAGEGGSTGGGYGFRYGATGGEGGGLGGFSGFKNLVAMERLGKRFGPGGASGMRGANTLLQIFGPKAKAVPLIFEMEHVPVGKTLAYPMLEGISITPTRSALSAGQMGALSLGVKGKEGLKEGGLFSQIQTSGQKLRQETAISSRQKIGQITKMELKTGQIISQLTRAVQSVGENTSQIQVPWQGTTTTTTTTTTTVPKITTTTVPRHKIPPPPPPPPPPFLRSLQFRPEKREKQKRKARLPGKQPHAFTPSLIAGFKNLYGKTSEEAITSGLGIRKIKKGGRSMKRRWLF